MIDCDDALLAQLRRLVRRLCKASSVVIRGCTDTFAKEVPHLRASVVARKSRAAGSGVTHPHICGLCNRANLDLFGSKSNVALLDTRTHTPLPSSFSPDTSAPIRSQQFPVIN